MTLSANIIRAIDCLLTDGEVNRSGLASLRAGYQLGLWANADAVRAVATPEAVRLLRTLPSRTEAIAAILACELARHRRCPLERNGQSARCMLFSALDDAANAVFPPFLMGILEQLIKQCKTGVVLGVYLENC